MHACGAFYFLTLNVSLGRGTSLSFFGASARSIARSRRTVSLAGVYPALRLRPWRRTGQLDLERASPPADGQRCAVEQFPNRGAAFTRGCHRSKQTVVLQMSTTDPLLSETDSFLCVRQIDAMLAKLQWPLSEPSCALGLLFGRRLAINYLFDRLCGQFFGARGAQ